MTRSIFDPTGPNTERSGNTFLGADAGNRSHMPDDVVDGVAAEGQGTPQDAVELDAAGQPVEPPPAVEAQVAQDDAPAAQPDDGTPAGNAAGWNDPFEDPEGPARRNPGQ